MSNYRFKQNREGRRSVQITKRTLKINPLAIIICLLIAIVFWLNAVNLDEQEKESATSTAQTADCGGWREL